MATQDVQLPEIGEGVTEGELVKWLVKPGDVIKVDQPIVELMTDKATVEVPSTKAGKVTDLKFKVGDTVKVGNALITIDADASSSAKPAATTPAQKPAGATPAAPPTFARMSPVAASTQTQMSVSQVNPPPANANVLATPSTRRLAREMNVDINNMSGSGLAGRVTREDVMGRGNGGGMMTTSGGMSAPQRPMAPMMPLAPSVGMNEREERVPLKGIRKKIAENMQMSKHIIPHFTLMDEANVTALVKMREQLKPQADKMGLKITYLPFVIKALIATVREFPSFNGSIDDAAQEIVYKKHFHIGFAADTPNGLLVPVIKHADQKTIAQLSYEIMDLSTRAREGKLKLEEMKGATFTVTNIGSVGGTYATPIINHPEVFIFGMYKIQDKPVPVNGKIKFIKAMNFTVTCDHRLIDGAEAARFLSKFISRIENPGRLMMDMI